MALELQSLLCTLENFIQFDKISFDPFSSSE